MKNTTHDIAQWTRNIITWALLGIAAAQFTDLRDTVKEMHKLVIKHDTQLENHKEEIDRLREIERPQISQKR
jgi:allophanate hydrolase subunit 1